MELTTIYENHIIWLNSKVELIKLTNKQFNCFNRSFVNYIYLYATDKDLLISLTWLVNIYLLNDNS